jgi:hypothetical protein
MILPARDDVATDSSSSHSLRPVRVMTSAMSAYLSRSG